jgi:thymidylate synthase ThyX
MITIVEPGAKLVTPVSHLVEYAKLIERIGRTCYKSEERITDDSAYRFIKGIIKRGHESVIEHCSVSYRIICSRACYDSLVEVYTENGWKKFADLKKTDKVLTLRTDGVSEFQKPTRYIDYHYRGKLHHYESQNIDAAVTPDHQMYIRKYDTRTPQGYSLVSSKDINVNRFWIKKSFDWHNENYEDGITIKGAPYSRKYRNGHMEAPVTHTMYPQYSPPSQDLSCFVGLLAWYLAEGSTWYNKKENSYQVTICQHNLETRKRIARIIQECGLTATICERSVTFKDLALGEFLHELGLSNEKFIPWNLMHQMFTPELADAFLEEYIEGDGTTETNGHQRIYTTSKIMADQLQILSFIAGYTASIWLDDRTGQSHEGPNGAEIRWNYPGYVVSLSKGARNKNGLIKRNVHFSEKDYDGQVYCVEVPNHTLFIRRNGLAYWCGNCSHQLVRHRIAAYSQESQRYCDYGKLGFQVIIPPKIQENAEALKHFTTAMENDYSWYLTLRDMGILPEDARFVLPNASKTEVVATYNLRMWRHLLKERWLNTHAQWEIRKVMNDIAYELNHYLPVFFEDIVDSK